MVKEDTIGQEFQREGGDMISISLTESIRQISSHAKSKWLAPKNARAVLKWTGGAQTAAEKTTKQAITCFRHLCMPRRLRISLSSAIWNSWLAIIHVCTYKYGRAIRQRRRERGDNQTLSRTPSLSVIHGLTKKGAP